MKLDNFLFGLSSGYSSDFEESYGTQFSKSDLKLN